MSRNVMFSKAFTGAPAAIGQFETPEDIAVAELKIEMMFPADDATRDALLAMQPRG